MSIHKLVLIHPNVKEPNIFSDNTIDGVKSIFIKNNITVESILTQLDNVSNLTHMAFVFVNYNNKAPFFEYTTNEMEQRMNNIHPDKFPHQIKPIRPEFYSSDLFFSTICIELITTLKTRFSTFKHIDI